MKLSLSFGDIFKYKGDDYVYLAEADTGKYAAKILGRDLTKELEKRYEYVARVGSKVPTQHQVIYLYVVLETPEYVGQACFHGVGAKEHDGFELYLDVLNISLNDNDKKALRDDIIKRAVNAELKNVISKIKL